MYLTQIICLSVIGTSVVVYGSNLDVLLRELEELTSKDAISRKEERLNQVMSILTSPIDDYEIMFLKREEGEICTDDGIMATCQDEVSCDQAGTSTCYPICDSYNHGGSAHFYCKCEREFVGTYCNVSRSEAQGKCRDCKTKGGRYCSIASSSASGYYCYDSKFHTMDITDRGLQEREFLTQREKIDSNMAKILYDYISSQP